MNNTRGFDVSSCVGMSSILNRPFKVLVSAITFVAFFINIFAYDIAFAAPAEHPSFQPGKSNLVRLGDDLTHFTIP